jgi:hypothetical protein
MLVLTGGLALLSLISPAGSFVDDVLAGSLVAAVITASPSADPT